MDDAKVPGRPSRPAIAASGWGRTLDDIWPVGIFRMDLSGACIDVNERWCALTGLSRDEGLGSGWQRVLHPGDRDSIVADWDTVSGTGDWVRREHRVVRPDGTQVWVIAEVHPVRDRGGVTLGYVGTLTDVTALAGARHALRREKELKENIIGSSVDGILAFDREYRYTVWNPAMEKLTGLPEAETLGRCAFDVFPFLREIGEDQYLDDALAGREAIAKDRRYVVPSTGREGFFEGRYSPLRNQAGDVVGGLAIIRDITAVKDAEAKLLQAGRLAAMGQLGAGVAHELNQPLTGIRLLLDMIRERGDRRVGEVTGELDVIAEQVQRMGRIVENIRGFARRSAFTPYPVPATRPLQSALALMAEQLRLAGIEVVETIEPDLPAVHADELQLQQVFLNLLSNALHALETHAGARTMRIDVRSRGDRVEVRLEDSGPGVPVEIRKQLFEPFFTTKDPGHGTGLGLSLCYGIMQAHGGAIRFEAPEGGGACFVIEVPHAHAGDGASIERPPPAHEERKARVLLVDDERLLREVLGRSLTHLGHVFVAASDGDSALVLARQETFDLALIDLKMPKMNGRTLCARLRELRPDLPLVIMSGFITEAERVELVTLGVRAILTKPFDGAILGEVIGECLAGDGARTPSDPG